MGSTNKTANYNLSQYVDTDKPTYLGDYNHDMVTIDSAIKSVADTSASSASAAQTSASNAVTTANAAATTAASAQTTANGAVTTANGAVQASTRPVSLYGKAGVDFTGATDSSAAVQAIINGAGAGAKIELGKGGRLRLDSSITLLNFQTLEGPVYQLGSGVPAVVELDFSHMPGASAGIVCGASNVLRNLFLRGAGYAGTQTGISASGNSPRFENVQVYSFGVGIALTNAYYSGFVGCEFAYCGVGLKLTACNNITLYNPRFKCSDETTSTFGTAIQTGTTRPVSVFGGSIENYGAAGGVVVGSDAILNLYGVYFESGTAGAGGIGITATQGSSQVNLHGCMTYLDNMNRWVNFGGGATASSLVASGNKFVCQTSSTTTPVAYALYNTGPIDVSLRGDNWAGVLKGAYTGGGATLPAAGIRVSYPQGAGHVGFEYLGTIQLYPAGVQGDTSGATLTQIEAEVNALKAKLRVWGLIS